MLSDTPHATKMYKTWLVYATCLVDPHIWLGGGVGYQFSKVYECKRE